MKRLILCCDGTWNRADQAKAEDDGPARPTPTNVVKLAYRVAKHDGAIPQLVFYDQGVGTGNILDRVLGGAFGDGLDENIFDAYRFLMANYEAGDELFFFGFSRGAYTARSIGGMIRKCGILKRSSFEQYANAMQLYRSEAKPDGPEAVAFRREHSITGDEPIPIRFIGVWDTVGSLGIPLQGLRWLTFRKHAFHDTELSSLVKHACHALAIDELRGPFEPTLWTAKPKDGQLVEQVWFSGVHSDVGGGYNDDRLSDLTLAWMLERAGSAGLALDPTMAAQRPVKGDSRGALHPSKTGFYRLTRAYRRPIGLDARTGTRDPRQHVHPSVLARWDRDPGYRPENLRGWFRLVGDRQRAAQP
ncbi:MAG: DUF2235 domain-containing protein [Planctomycetes bacterium]|nr:DUF2235 domain-containing protein [Planctomycetota bacterium]